jgi:hypothetical protein
MKKRIRVIVGGFQDTTMFLALAVWLCVVPLVLLFTLPFFGWQGGLTAAVVTFLLALALCRAVCLYPQIADPATSSGTHTEEK